MLMSDWTAGYVADIGYTYGYYTELNPLRVKLAFLNAGLSAPEMGTACELGFGQGMSTNLQAAASVVKWYGTDFNPSQAACAQEFAALSGSMTAEQKSKVEPALVAYREFLTAYVASAKIAKRVVENIGTAAKVSQPETIPAEL
jgi:hypothetical protein